MSWSALELLTLQLNNQVNKETQPRLNSVLNSISVISQKTKLLRTSVEFFHLLEISKSSICLKIPQTMMNLRDLALSNIQLEKRP